MAAADDLPLRLAAAEAVAREAGALALRHFRNRDALAVESKAPGDLVSRADREVEALVRARLMALYPVDAVLGEEAGESGTGEGVWVVDPIDGTWCFLNGIQSWCVSLAYVRGGRIEIGVIFDPCAGELFATRAGGGAALDGRPIRAAASTHLPEATISVGINHRVPIRVVVPVIDRILAAGAMFHRHGSGALGLAWVACGRLAAYVEPHMNSWDALAGLLLVQEAGGRVNDFLAGDGLRRGNRVVAVAPQLAAAVDTLIGDAF